MLLASDSPQTIPPGESKLVWLSVESTGSSTGTFEYETSITVGVDVHVVPLTVHVHNVSLTTATPLTTGNWFDLNTGEHPLFAQVRDSMLSHRITMGASSAQGFPKKDKEGIVIRPIEIDFTSVDKFLDFHQDFDQVSSFYPFSQHVDRPHYDWFGPAEWMSDEFKKIFSEWIVAFTTHVRARGRDYDEFYFHLFDKTLDPKVAQLCELVHQADPKIRTMITIPQASRSSVEHLVKAGMNIFNYHATRLGYDNDPDGFEMMRTGGRELWIYGAADASYGGGKERDPLEFYRYLYWTAYRHELSGVQFWNMLHNRSPAWAPENVRQNYWPLVYPVGGKYPEPPEDARTAEQVIPSRR